MQKPIIVPDDFTYVPIFLTLSCQLRCSYCLNFHGDDLLKGRRMTKDDWIGGLNRIQTRPGLPITLQGGEPTIYKYFYDVVNGIDERIELELLTNLEIDVDKFCQNIPPNRFKRKFDDYPAIRVSYHHGQSKFQELLERVLELKRRGYSIAIWEVGHPGYINYVYERQTLATLIGVDYRVKEFLGPWNGKNYGTMGYADAVNSDKLRHCECKTSELLIAPDGHIFRCHSDLYAGRLPIGHLLDDEPPKLGEWRHCAVYGRCNSCDIRVQDKSYKKKGHISVQIRNIGEPHTDNQQLYNVVNTYGKK